MAAKRDNRELSIIPGGMRSDFREEQINAIKAQVRKEYADRIRKAASKDEKRLLKAERDVEIARQIESLIRERNLDTPECL